MHIVCIFDQQPLLSQTWFSHFMNRTWTILLFTLCLSFSVNGQNQTNNFKHIFSNSDSVFISSHDDLRFSKGPGKDAGDHKIAVDGKHNKEIVREIVKLDRISRDSLSDILRTPNPDSLIEDIKCFEPHHSILIYRNGECSYFDICFGCKHFITSKDIEFEDDYLSNDTWRLLELFFRNRNINFQMPEIEKEGSDGKGNL